MSAVDLVCGPAGAASSQRRPDRSEADTSTLPAGSEQPPGRPAGRRKDAPIVDRPEALPRLSKAHCELIRQNGAARPIKAGEVLFREGDRLTDFILVDEGAVDFFQGPPEDEHQIAHLGPGNFLENLDLVAGQTSYISVRVCEDGTAVFVPFDRVCQLAAHDVGLLDVMLRAALARRSVLIEIGAGLRIVGSRFSADTRRLLEFAARNRLPHRWLDLERDSQAEAMLRRLGVRPEETPVVLWGGDRVLRNPSNAQLADVIGMRPPLEPDTTFDLIVVGAGPAGLASAVYGASEGLKTVVVDSTAAGGQAGRSMSIENYLGFPAGITGGELAERATLQARKFGARLMVPSEAVSLERDEAGRHLVRLDDGTLLHGRTLVIATGARYKRLPVPKVEQFEGTSVHYAATEVEAQMCKDSAVAVVGGGNSAGQAAVFLARRSSKVRIIIRGADLARTMSRYLIDEIEKNDKIEVWPNTEVRELHGEESGPETAAGRRMRLLHIVVENRNTHQRQQVEARAVFVFIGTDPHVKWLEGKLSLDRDGFILTGNDAIQGRSELEPADQQQEKEQPQPQIKLQQETAQQQRQGMHQSPQRVPLMLETSRPGVFAVGDVRSGSIKRIATAVGEGAMAVRLVWEHLGV
eukprot:TRINITY_DN2684_c0_g2_i3.p1 TRINITY_DN2684_c0_g2~~TRINITY_DN2684_c0_g2_i3.p1  ORF type:complete len:637 (-),score=250.03 TRINITY_DN2684_c0_g2_i3:237-2147(-)